MVKTLIQLRLEDAEQRIKSLQNCIYRSRRIFPFDCELCGHNLQSIEDFEYHGLGECVTLCDTCLGSGTSDKPDKSAINWKQIAQGIISKASAACDAFAAQPNHGDPNAKRIMDELRESIHTPRLTYIPHPSPGTIDTVISTLRTVADNIEKSDAFKHNWAQCNVHDLRREAKLLESLK